MTGKPKAPPILVLIAATATGPLALNLFVPSMPGLVSLFGTDYGTVQLTLTLYLAGVAIGQLIYGPVSDRIGRRPTLLAGLGVFALASLLCAFATSIDLLIAGRVFQALGGCAGMVLGRAIVRDVYERDEAAPVIAYITMAMAVAPMIGPAVGGYLDSAFGWYAGFLLVAAAGGAVLVYAFPTLHETHQQRDERIDVAGLLRNYGALLSSKAYLGYTLNTSFSIGCFFAFLSSAPYVTIEILGLGPQIYGFYFIVVSLSYMSGNFIATRISRRLGIDRMILLGCSVSLLGAFVLTTLSALDVISATAIFLPFALVAFGNGMSQPNAIAGSVSVNPAIAGAASGLMGFMQMCAGGLATVLVGYFQDATGYSALAYALLIGTFGAHVSLFLARRATLREGAMEAAE
ncbi:multidrug effflux MFS transporter [Nisaea acidiphila]|uniref:Bcr/CflA family efflux transporter n=1 Tax=Nisaea acidiphila TaxID=1862145 RepID=A0A9J7AXZ1_9PROT|nr:multidrug effflux MFS transporter [Nisaea acidiphila]UUX50293.1 multidrug effflux MFS transporter [Nisaea acidiphila]